MKEFQKVWFKINTPQWADYFTYSVVEVQYTVVCVVSSFRSMQAVACFKVKQLAYSKCVIVPILSEYVSSKVAAVLRSIFHL